MEYMLTGVAPYDAKDGVIVSGGELKIESKRPTGSSVTNCAIFAGYKNAKDIKISGTSKVDLTTNYLGIGLIDSKSSLYMQGGNLSIEGAVQGIYTQATWNGNIDRKSTRLNSSHPTTSRMPSSA